MDPRCAIRRTQTPVVHIVRHSNYAVCMTVLTVRTDKEVDAALDILTEGGESKSEVIRRALIEAAKLRRAEKLHAEAIALANDPEDRAEARRVLADMEPLRAW